MRAAPRTAALRTMPAAAVLMVTAACTSSGPPPRSSAPGPSSTAQRSSPTTTAAATSAPTTSTPAAPGSARLRGAILLLGSNPDTANVYAVTAGGFRALTRLPPGSRVADVTADRSHVVITDNARTHADHIDVIEGSGVSDLGLGAAFGPALSGTGALTWVALAAGAKNPGITKPTSYVVAVRDSLRGTSRPVYRSALSVASPQWIGPHAVVVAESNGENTRLVRIDTTTRATRTLATIPSSDALDLTAGPAFLTAWDGASAAIVSLAGRTLGHLATGWRPLCWLPSGALLGARGGRFASITVTGERASAPHQFALAPAGLSVYAASCARVHPS